MVFRDFRIRYLAFPGITFLPSYIYPTRVTMVVGGTAILPVVVVVRYQVGVDIIFFSSP